MANINDLGFPFTSVAGDRQYSAAEFRTYFTNLFSDGPLAGIDNELEVNPQATPNKTIFVDTGAILIKGAMRHIESVANLTCASNTSGNPRIDRIIARLNYTDRKIEFAVLQGTPASSPVAPALTQNTTDWELSLAQIALANGYSTITSSEITDERSDDDVCGWAKISYMDEFDNENNLLKYNRDVITVDGSGNPTEVQYKRPADSTLALKRNYSNADSNGFYQTIVELFYLADGSTVYKTHTYTLVFYANGLIDTMTRAVS